MKLSLEWSGQSEFGCGYYFDDNQILVTRDTFLSLLTIFDLIESDIKVQI